MPPIGQELALTTLSISALWDFEIVCADGVKVGCSRKLLEERWPWLRERLAAYRDVARNALAVHRQGLHERESNGVNGAEPPTASVADESEVPDVRVTARTLHLPESSDIARALVEYLYTQALCTPHQHQLPVLVGLLVLARAYDLPNLFALVTHALHGVLGGPAAATAPAQIYEAATLAGALALQVRSLKQLMVRCGLVHRLQRQHLLTAPAQNANRPSKRDPSRGQGASASGAIAA